MAANSANLEFFTGGDLLSTGSYEQAAVDNPINRKDYSCRFPSIQSQRTTELPQQPPQVTIPSVE